MGSFSLIGGGSGGCGRTWWSLNTKTFPNRTIFPFRSAHLFGWPPTPTPIFMFYSGDDDDDARPCVVIALDRSDPVPVPVSHIVLFMWKLNMCEGWAFSGCGSKWMVVGERWATRVKVANKQCYRMSKMPLTYTAQPQKGFRPDSIWSFPGHPWPPIPLSLMHTNLCICPVVGGWLRRHPSFISSSRANYRFNRKQPTTGAAAAMAMITLKRSGY